jgi:predicted nucleotidyltransferase
MLKQISSDSVRTISLERDKVLSALSAVAAKIREERPEVVSVRLFGSIARGDQVGTSDADVLIVLRAGTQGDPVDWIRTYYGYFRLPVPVDLLVYGEDQVAGRLNAGDLQFTRLWTESLDLCEPITTRHLLEQSSTAKSEKRTAGSPKLRAKSQKLKANSEQPVAQS